MHPSWRRLALSAWLASAAASAAKDNPKTIAKQHYTAGLAAYNLENYDGAIKEFESAYLLVQDASFLYNIGQAHRMAKRPERALLFYRRYLSNVPNAPNRSDVERCIANLEKEQAAAKVVKPPPATPPAPPAKPPPRAVPLLESETQTRFPSNLVTEGKLFTLVGLGARKVCGVKIYGMAMYVEDEPARAAMAKLAARAGGKDLGHLTANDLALSYLLLGDFCKLGILKFVRDVSASDVRKAYRESLEDELKSPSPALKKNITRFVDLFTTNAKKGAECTIMTTPTGEIFVEQGAGRAAGPTDPQLAQAIWSIWLGKHPISADLRKALVNHIDAVAR